MSTVYRCKGCGHYVRTQWKRIGLSSVCSEACERLVRQRGGNGRDRNTGRQSQRGDDSRDPGPSESPSRDIMSAIETSAGDRPATATAQLEGCAGLTPATGRDCSTLRVASPATTRTTCFPRAAGLSRQNLPTGTRERIIARDGRCRFCGTVENLHVHHIVYRSQGGGHEDTNLITLCVRHHDVVHSDKATWQPVLQAYIETFYTTGCRAFLLALKRGITAPQR